jgi:hypothetical protein
MNYVEVEVIAIFMFLVMTLLAALVFTEDTRVHRTVREAAAVIVVISVVVCIVNPAIAFFHWLK